MQLKKSIVVGQCNDNITAELTTAHSDDVIPDAQLNIRMVQNVLLIWLDETIDENNADCRNTIGQLRHVINTIHKFTNSEDCIQFLTNINKEKACMIISGSLGQDTVPKIHNMSQVDSIFIFCNDTQYHEQWIYEWSKVRGIFTEILPICEALKPIVDKCEQNAIPMSIMTIDEDAKQNLDQLEPSFMYVQIMKEILLNIDFEEQHFQQYINYCRAAFVDNNRELQNIIKFEQTYRDKTPIWWYTLQCFLYPMLNRALRMMDVDIIIKMAFFIKDLHSHIEQLHDEQFHSSLSSDKFVVYRGQGMIMTEFERIRTSEGGLISFNNFLSTSKKQSVSLRFVQSTLLNPDLIGVLFIINIDPSQSTTPFASIKDVSSFKGEDEVLFAMQTVFRIGKITSTDEDPRLFHVELTLTSDNDKDLRQLTDYIRKETGRNDQGWFRLGMILERMGYFEKCEDVCHTLLEQTTDDIDKVPLYNQLGLVKNEQGKYHEAIRFYAKIVDIGKRLLSWNSLLLAEVCNNIGMVYDEMGERSKSLTYYEKSLEIQQQLFPPNHPRLAKCYNNIGIVYEEMNEYSKALPYFLSAFEIDRKSLPPTHPELASAYDQIGAMYEKMHEYSKSLSHYEKAFQIRKQSLPSNHPELANSYLSFGIVYKAMKEYSKSISFFEKALEIQQQSLASNHLDLASTYRNIGLVYSDMSEYSKALSYYEKSLEIWQQSPFPNHPDLASCYYSIGMVYYNMNEYAKALLYYEKVLEIKQQILPPNDPDLASSYNNIGSLYGQMNEYAKALPYFERLLEIQQQSLPSNHPNLATYYYNIGMLYDRMGQYSKTLLYYEKSLEIQQQILPSGHPSIAASYDNIGSVYEKMGNYAQAYSFFERALQMAQQALSATHPGFETISK